MKRGNQRVLAIAVATFGLAGALTQFLFRTIHSEPPELEHPIQIPLAAWILYGLAACCLAALITRWARTS